MVIVSPGTSYMDDFKQSKNPIIERIWTERINPHIDDLPTGTRNLVELLATSGSEYALYDNYFGIV